MRSFCICGCGFDSNSGRMDSVLDFLFDRCQRIVRDVHRAVLYFGFDHAVQRFDRIGYLLWRTGSPNCLISIRAATVSLRLKSAGSRLFFIPQDVRVRRDDFVYLNARAR